MEEKKEKPAKRTLSDQIWDKIKDLDLEMYALSGQTVEKHCQRVPVTDNEVYLILKSSAVLPALENVLLNVKMDKENKFEISQTKKYVIVSVIPV